MHLKYKASVPRINAKGELKCLWLEAESNLNLDAAVTGRRTATWTKTKTSRR